MQNNGRFVKEAKGHGVSNVATQQSIFVRVKKRSNKRCLITHILDIQKDIMDTPKNWSTEKNTRNLPNNSSRSMKTSTFSARMKTNLDV